MPNPINPIPFIVGSIIHINYVIQQLDHQCVSVVEIAQSTNIRTIIEIIISILFLLFVILSIDRIDWATKPTHDRSISSKWDQCGSMHVLLLFIPKTNQKESTRKGASCMNTIHGGVIDHCVYPKSNDSSLSWRSLLPLFVIFCGGCRWIGG